MLTPMKWVATALAVIAILLAVGVGNNHWAVVKYSPDMAIAAGQVAGALFVVAVFLERALSVINDLLFSERSVDNQSSLRKALLDQDADQTALTLWKIDDLDKDKERLRLGIGFLAAVLIAGAGVRTFAGLLDVAKLAGNQRTLLDTMDILLTAGLLAGGSNGLALIIDMFKKRGQDQRDQQLLFADRPDGATQQRLERAGLRPPRAPRTPIKP